jgi:hypothetical protein
VVTELDPSRCQNDDRRCRVTLPSKDSDTAKKRFDLLALAAAFAQRHRVGPQGSGPLCRHAVVAGRPATPWFFSWSVSKAAQ